MVACLRVEPRLVSGSSRTGRSQQWRALVAAGARQVIFACDGE